MKAGIKKIKTNDYYNYEGIEDNTKNVFKHCINNKNNFDDILQKINMLHEDYQSRIFSNDFSDFDNIFKSYFCGLQKADNKDRRS